MIVPTDESDSDYDGPLSYAAEWHAVGVGVVIGFFAGYSKTLRSELPKEPQYLLVALFCGWVVGWLVDKWSD